MERKCTPNEKIIIDCKSCSCITKGTGLKCEEPNECLKQKIAETRSASDLTDKNDFWSFIEKMLVWF